MVNVEELYNFLHEKDICYYTGVPDSQLRPFCDYITLKLGIGENHIIAANEGNAVALVSGYHLATGKTGVVYMQNSGLGNAVNPITSLTDPAVYGIPVIYMIGWRGEPGVKDEPQHVKQGKITKDLLKLLGIEYVVISEETEIEMIIKTFENIFEQLLKQGKSVAFLISINGLEEEKELKKYNKYEMTREEAIGVIVDNQRCSDLIVSTTGKASRELFEYRETKNQGHERDFLTVGSMGHASMIAMSMAENSKKRIWCLDGDGAMIMHLGAAALIGNRKPKNLVHVLLNNGVHETVGGMQTISYSQQWDKAVESFGYRNIYIADNRESLVKVLDIVKKAEGPIFLEIMINADSRNDLIRPTIKPVDNKKNIMSFLNT